MPVAMVTLDRIRIDLAFPCLPDSRGTCYRLVGIETNPPWRKPVVSLMWHSSVLGKGSASLDARYAEKLRIPDPMSASPAGPAPGDSSYIRGGGGIEIDTGRAIRFVTAAGVLVLVTLVVALTISAMDQNARQTKLQKRGVPVQMTVTGCVAISSGIGQAIVAYTCRGTYSLDGHQYNEVIGGSTALHQAGQKLDGVTVRGDPGLLSTASAVAQKKSSWSAYVTPIVLGAVAVALALGLVLWPKRRRAGHGRPAAP